MRSVIPCLLSGSVKSPTGLHEVQGQLATPDRRGNRIRLWNANGAPIPGRKGSTPSPRPKWTSKLDEKTHEANFQKEPVALFKTTEAIKGDHMNTTLFPMAAVAPDAQPGMASPTLALLMVLAQDLARRNEKEPKLTHQTWHQLLTEPLSQVAERLGISVPVLLYNVSPFWFPNFVQAECNLDEHNYAYTSRP